MFNKYYQEELEYLREMGAEFSRANPSAAPFLEERGADPDVERLLELVPEPGSHGPLRTRLAALRNRAGSLH